jgi:tetratricopeptide (TPR) repeat protein
MLEETFAWWKLPKKSKRSEKRESNSTQDPLDRLTQSDLEEREWLDLLMESREHYAYSLRSLYPGSYKTDDLTLMVNRELPPHIHTLVMLHELTHAEFGWQHYGEMIRRLEHLAILVAIPLHQIRINIMGIIHLEELGPDPDDKKTREFYERVALDQAMRQRIRDRLASDQFFMRGLRFLDKVDKRKRLLLAHWKRAQEGVAYWRSLHVYEQKIESGGIDKRKATELARIVKEKLLVAEDENGEGFRMVSEIARIWGAELIDAVMHVIMAPDVTRMSILHASLADINQMLSTPCFSPDRRLEATYHMAISRSFVPQNLDDVLELYQLLDPDNPQPILSIDGFNAYWNTIDADPEFVSIVNDFLLRIGSEPKYEPAFIPPGEGARGPFKPTDPTELTLMDHEGQVLRESTSETWHKRASSVPGLDGPFLEPGAGPIYKQSMDKDLFLNTMRVEGLITDLQDLPADAKPIALSRSKELVMEIKPLLPEQGALLLLRSAGCLAPDGELSHASQEELRLALHISQELGGLPLAPDLASAFLKETGVDLAGFQQLYQQHRAALLRERDGLIPNHPEPVVITWSLSFRKIERANPMAADLLRICAFLSPDTIPEELVREGASKLGRRLKPLTDDGIFDQAIQVLHSYSLIRRTPQKHLFSIHRLIQAVLIDTMNATTYRRWAKRVVMLVSAALAGIDQSTRERLERYLPHIQSCVQLIDKLHLTFPAALQLLDKTGLYLEEQARYAEAEPLYRQRLHIWERALGPEHPGLTYVLTSLALLYEQQGKYAEAEPLLQRCLHNQEQALGSEHLDLAVPLYNLALLYNKQDKYAEAEPLFRRCLHIWEQSLGPEHLNLAEPLNGLAYLYAKQGKYAEAEPLYQRALTIREKGLGSEHPDLVEPLNGLAGLHLIHKKYSEAELLFRRCQRIRENALGLEHPEIARSLNNLALLYEQQGKYAEAEPLYLRCLSIQEQALGPKHPEIALLLNKLALAYARQGKYAEAEPLYLRYLRIQEQALGPEHFDLAGPLNGLAELYTIQGEYVEAEPLFRRCLHIWEQSLGPEHLNLAGPLNGLAYLYEKQGKYAEAELLYLRCLSIQEQALGPEHPDLAGPLNRLAELYTRQAKYAEAEPLFRRCLSIREQVLGSEHPDLAGPLNGLAYLYFLRGKYGESEPLYLHALMIQEKVLGPEHPDLAESLNGLASSYFMQGKGAEAEPLFWRCLSIREQALGPDHLDLAELLYNLAFLYEKQGKYVEAEPLYQRCLHIGEQALGSEHPDLAKPLYSLAVVYFRQGKLADAKPLFQRCLHIREQALGPEHPETISPLIGLANLYAVESQYSEAKQLYQHALHIGEQALGPDHPQTISPLIGLADLYEKQGRYTQAEPLYQRCLHIWEQALGSEHPNLAYPLSGLADLYTKQGKYAEAELLYQRALHIREQALGPAHRLTQSTAENYMSLLQAQGREDEVQHLKARFSFSA